jgi:hypothetical protein
METAKPGPEHLFLNKLLGNWTYDAEASTGPDKPPMKSSGTESVRTLGGIWFLGEAQGQTPTGEPATMLITLGYDPETKRYCGTWIGSMMTKLWIYDGFVEGNTLYLDSDGPSMAGDGKTAKYRDSMEFVDNDHRILRSQMLNDDGSWTSFMTSRYRRA